MTAQTRLARSGYPPLRRRWPRAVDDESHAFAGSHYTDCDAGGRDFTLPFITVLRKASAEHSTISMDENVLAGTPRIAGTRIPVYMVIDAILHYGSIEGARRAYRDLTEDQVKDVLAFAADVLEHRIEYEP